MYTEYRKGFISSFFLLFLISISSICLVLIFKVECEIRAIDNMKEVNKRFESEVEIVNFIKCKLDNDELETGKYFNGNHELMVEYNAYLIECKDNNDNIIIFYLNNGKITDYIYKNNE